MLLMPLSVSRGQFRAFSRGPLKDADLVAQSQVLPLQRGFYPGVAQINLVLFLQLLVKMAYVQIEVLLPV